MPEPTPYVYVTAVPRGADAVATLPAQIYARKLAGITVNAGTRGATVQVFIGSVTPSARVDQSPNGWNNTVDYSTPRILPASTPAFVVWPGLAAASTTCQATFHLVAA